MAHAGEPLVYFVSDGSVSDSNYDVTSARLLRHLSAVISAELQFAQIREKQLSTRSLFDLVCRAARITKGSRTKLLISDRLDVALAAGSDGVHLTAISVRPEAVRAAVRRDLLIGVSTHSRDEVSAAAAGGADFAVFGPVFDSPGKGAGVGTASLREAIRAADRMPVLALGGVDGSNIPDVIASGAAGFAAIRFLNDARNLARLGGEFDL